MLACNKKQLGHRKMQTKTCKKRTAESHASKKRNVVERIVVAVKVERHDDDDDDDKKHKSEGPPPSDSWSWRKYGQKPIKGSPYPRGYYRCSTSKGCTAKKQVERCKTDASVLIVTYTSTHNHPGPHLPMINNTNQEGEEPLAVAVIQDRPKTPIPSEEEEPKQEQKAVVKISDEEHLHYSQSPFSGCSQDDVIISSQEEKSFKEKLDITYDSASVILDKEPVCNCPPPTAINMPTRKSDENDEFFNELDELPTTSSFTELLRSNFLEGRILV